LTRQTTWPADQLAHLANARLPSSPLGTASLSATVLPLQETFKPNGSTENVGLSRSTIKAPDLKAAATCNFYSYTCDAIVFVLQYVQNSHLLF